MFSSTVPSLRVAAMPLVSRPGDAPHNVARIADCLALAAEKDIGLVVFPESCIGGCGDMAKLHRAELDALAEPLDGPSIRAVADAVERSGVAAGVGIIERASDGRLFNSYVVCLPDGVRHCHRKLHAFGHRRISSGDRFTVFDTTWGVRVGILIGGDNYLVENMRMTALMGATLLIAPHRSDEGVNCTDDRRTRSASMGQSLRRLLPARAGDNGMFVVFSEGVEVDGPEQSSGAGMIIDPCGRVLAESSARDELISADLDRGLIDASAGQQWLTTRRPELYGLLTRSGHRAADFEPRSVSSRGAIALSFAQVSRNRPIR